MGGVKVLRKGLFWGCVCDESVLCDWKPDCERPRFWKDASIGGVD